MKPVLYKKYFIKKDNSIFTPEVSKDKVIETFKELKIDIDDQLNKAIDDFFLSNNIYKNPDFKIEIEKAVELWKCLNDKITVQQIIQIYIKSECERVCNLIYEHHNDYSWRKQNFAFLKECIPSSGTPVELLEVKNEIDWCISPGYRGFVPVYWLRNYILIESALKKSEAQRTYNGPDFIFNNIEQNKTIGVEVTQVKPNTFVLDTKKISNVDKSIEKLSKSFNKKSGVAGTIKEIQRLIKKHTDDISGYKKCDKYVLILITNNNLPEYLYAFLEKYCNSINEKTGKRLFDKWEWIYIF